MSKSKYHIQLINRYTRKMNTEGKKGREKKEKNKQKR